MSAWLSLSKFYAITKLFSEHRTMKQEVPGAIREPSPSRAGSVSEEIINPLMIKFSPAIIGLLVNVCVASEFPQLNFCLNTGSIGICQSSGQNTTSMVFLGNAEKNPALCRKEDSNGFAGYGGDDTDSHKKKRWYSGIEELQYIVIRLWVRFMNGLGFILEQPACLSWGNALLSSVSSYDPLIFPVSNVYHLQPEKHLSDHFETHFGVLGDGSPQAVVTEIFHTEWQAYSGQDTPSPEISLSMVSSQEARGVVTIPFLVSYPDWNAPDQLQSQWLENPAEIFRVVRAAWGAVYPQLYQVLGNEENVDCQFNIQNDSATSPINIQCNPASVQPEQDFLVNKPQAFIIDLINTEPGSMPENSTRQSPVTKKDGGRQEAGQKTEEGRKAEEGATLAPGKKKFSLFSRKSKPPAREPEGRDPIGNAVFDLQGQVDDIERLVLRLREEIYEYLAFRFISAGASRTRFAEVLFDLYTMLESPFNQQTALSYFDRVDFSGFLKGKKFQLFGEDFRISARELCKRKIKSYWKHDKLFGLNRSGAMDIFYRSMMLDKRIVWQLIKKLNKRSPTPLNKDVLRQIEKHLKIMFNAPATFEYSPVYHATKYLLGLKTAVRRSAPHDTGTGIIRTGRRRLRTDTVSLAGAEDFICSPEIRWRTRTAPGTPTLSRVFRQEDALGLQTKPAPWEKGAEISLFSGYQSMSSGRTRSQLSLDWLSEPAGHQKYHALSLPRQRRTSSRAALPVQTGQLSEDIEKTIDGYLLLIDNFKPEQIIELANFLQAPNTYGLQDVGYFRGYEGNQQRLLAIMKEFVRRRFPFAPLNALRELTQFIEKIYPGVCFDDEGRF